MRPSSVGSMPCGVARGAVNRTLDPDRWPMKNTLYLAESLSGSAFTLSVTLRGSRASYRGDSELEQCLHGFDPSLGVNMDMHVDESRKHEVARNVSSSCRVRAMEVTRGADPEDSVVVYYNDAVPSRLSSRAVN